MVSLPHGYTNETVRSKDQVRKRYVGKAAEQRREVEAACLRVLQDHLPVPIVLGGSRFDLRMSFVEGSHGQDLIDDGGADMVLRLSGQLLAEMQGVSIDPLRQIPGSGDVLVHGDFGPQNLLIDTSAQRVTALLDWEFAHLGRPIERISPGQSGSLACTIGLRSTTSHVCSKATGHNRVGRSVRTRWLPAVRNWFASPRCSSGPLRRSSGMSAHGQRRPGGSSGAKGAAPSPAT